MDEFDVSHMFRVMQQSRETMERVQPLHDHVVQCDECINRQIFGMDPYCPQAEIIREP